MIPSHQRQPARSGPVSAIQEQQSPTKFLRRWSKGRCVFITSLVVAGYVLSYPIFAISLTSTISAQSMGLVECLRCFSFRSVIWSNAVKQLAFYFDGWLKFILLRFLSSLADKLDSATEKNEKMKWIRARCATIYPGGELAILSALLWLFSQF